MGSQRLAESPENAPAIELRNDRLTKRRGPHAVAEYPGSAEQVIVPKFLGGLSRVTLVASRPGFCGYGDEKFLPSWCASRKRRASANDQQEPIVPHGLN